MPTEVIYARVPKTLKEAADAYATQRGGSLTKAVADLLDRGLNATSDRRAVSDLETKLERVTAEKAQIESELHAARGELAVLNNLVQRARIRVGSCPKASCQQPITGYDLLGSGRCQSCGESLTGLVAPAD